MTEVHKRNHPNRLKEDAITILGIVLMVVVCFNIMLIQSSESGIAENEVYRVLIGFLLTVICVVINYVTLFRKVFKTDALGKRIGLFVILGIGLIVFLVGLVFVIRESLGEFDVHTFNAYYEFQIFMVMVIILQRVCRDFWKE